MELLLKNEVLNTCHKIFAEVMGMIIIYIVHNMYTKIVKFNSTKSRTQTKQVNEFR